MSDKYRKEIEEILRHAEEVLPKDRPKPPRGQSRASGGLSNPLSRLTGGRGLRISAGKLMLASFALLLLALILGAAGFGVIPLIVAGLVVFVIAYALFFVRPGVSSSYEKRWRGRLIEDSPSLWDRVKRWLKS